MQKKNTYFTRSKFELIMIFAITQRNMNFTDNEYNCIHILSPMRYVC